MSLSDAVEDGSEQTGDDDDDTDQPGSKRAEKVAAAIGIAAGMTGSLTFIGMLIAYVFGIERERIKGTGVNRSKIKYAAKEPLYSMVGIALGYSFNTVAIGKQITVLGGL